MAENILNRIEPGVYGEMAKVERNLCLASIAISLKRIADAMEQRPSVLTFDGPLTPDQIKEITRVWEARFANRSGDWRTP
jgi:hypothetical protein